MEQIAWKSRAKNDLIIEVWEYLDCESIGAKEIFAIEQAVRERFGDGAVDNPMIIARLLADEGAELRHPEIMELFVKYEQSDPYDAMLRGVLKAENLKHTLTSIKNLENFRRKFLGDNDKKGLHRVRELGLRGKNEAIARAKKDDLSAAESGEIAAWFALWLETPELFDSWVALRTRSPEFREKFGEIF
jgi:hypothetical protein